MKNVDEQTLYSMTVLAWNISWNRRGIWKWFPKVHKKSNLIDNGFILGFEPNTSKNFYFL